MRTHYERILLSFSPDNSTFQSIFATQLRNFGFTPIIFSHLSNLQYRDIWAVLTDGSSYPDDLNQQHVVKWLREGEAVELDGKLQIVSVNESPIHLLTNYLRQKRTSQ